MTLLFGIKETKLEHKELCIALLWINGTFSSHLLQLKT